MSACQTFVPVLPCCVTHARTLFLFPCSLRGYLPHRPHLLIPQVTASSQSKTTIRAIVGLQPIQRCLRVTFPSHFFDDAPLPFRRGASLTLVAIPVSCPARSSLAGLQPLASSSSHLGALLLDRLLPPPRLCKRPEPRAHLLPHQLPQALTIYHP